MAETFWGRVLYLLDCKDISRKEFAYTVGISYSSIHNGNERNSIPSADIALKIADVLNTSIEYLVYGNKTLPPAADASTQNSESNNEKLLYRKNKDIIDALEAMPAQAQKSIREMIVGLKKAF